MSPASTQARTDNSSLPGTSEHLADDESLLLRFTRTRDQKVREELVQRYMPFARRLAMRYRAGSESTDDLVQVANLGLLKALDRFDAERGIPFVAFAAPTILGELKRHFRDRVWTLRVPRGLQERIALLDRERAKLTGELGRHPTVQELGERLALDDEGVLEALEASSIRNTLSLDQPVTMSETEAEPIAERVGVDDPHFDTVEERAVVEQEFPVLDQRERLVLKLRLVDEMTQSQIAEQIGFSQMHVSRILRRALDRLRDAVERRSATPAARTGTHA
jgi:RNA polymerase sigma-B factor